MEDGKKLIEEMGQAVHSLRADVDKKYAELAAKGSVQAETVQKMDRANEDISKLQKQLEELEKKLGRPVVGGEGEKPDLERRELFKKYLRKSALGLSPEETRALSTGDDANGGYLVPKELDKMISTVAFNETPMRGLCQVIQAGPNYEKVFDTGGEASAWVGETETRSDTATPATYKIKPVHGTVQASPKATEDMLSDAMFDVEGWLAEVVGRKFGQAEDAAFVSGSGINQPKGILSHTFAATADASRAFGSYEYMKSGSNGTFDADDLINLFHKLKPAYRNQSKFVMAAAAAALVRTLKDSGQGYLWQPSLALGSPQTVLGRELVEDENMPAYTTTAAKAVMVGDFRAGYLIVDVRSTRVLRNPYSTHGQVIFYSTKRLSGGAADTNAIKVLTTEA